MSLDKALDILILYKYTESEACNIIKSIHNIKTS